MLNKYRCTFSFFSLPEKRSYPSKNFYFSSVPHLSLPFPNCGVLDDSIELLVVIDLKYYDKS